MLRRLLRGDENVRRRALKLVNLPLKAILISFVLAVLLVYGDVFGDILKTPAGFEIAVDFKTAEQLGLKGVLLIRFRELPADGGGKKGTAGLFVCDFDRKEGYFIDLGSLGEGVYPFAITEERNTVFSLVPVGDNNGKGPIKTIAVMRLGGGKVRYLEFTAPPASDVFYSEDENAVFFSFVDENVTLKDNTRVEITARMDLKTGNETRITKDTGDCHLCAVAEEARLLLVAEELPDVWGVESLNVYNFAGDEIEVRLESTDALRGPYKRRLSADGKRLLLPEWGKYIGVLCAGEADKPDLFVLEDGESENLTQDEVIWESYDISPNGLYVGVIVPGADFGYSPGPYLCLIDIDTKERFRVIDFPRRTSVELIRWNK